MPIECHFFGPLRDAVGEKTIEREIPPDADVTDVIEDLVATYPDLEEPLLDDDGEIRETVNITKNKQHINHLGGPDTPVGDGDVLRFASAVIGGRVGPPAVACVEDQSAAADSPANRSSGIVPSWFQPRSW